MKFHQLSFSTEQIDAALTAANSIDATVSNAVGAAISAATAEGGSISAAVAEAVSDAIETASAEGGDIFDAVSNAVDAAIETATAEGGDIFNAISYAVDEEAKTRDEEIRQAIDTEAEDRQQQIDELRDEIINTNIVLDGVRTVELRGLLLTRGLRGGTFVPRALLDVGYPSGAMPWAAGKTLVHDDGGTIGVIIGADDTNYIVKTLTLSPLAEDDSESGEAPDPPDEPDEPEPDGGES